MVNNPPASPFAATDHLALALTLKDIALKVVSHKDEAVGQALNTLINHVWNVNPSTEKQEEFFNQAVSGLGEEQKSLLLASYARLGHLYEIAGLAARENFLRTAPLQSTHNGQAKALGTASEFVNAQPSADEAVEKLNRPVFEIAPTQHPTNTNGLESIKAQWQLGLALHAKDVDEKAVEDAVRKYMETPLLHQKNGQDANFTVRDETEMVLHALSNVYDELPNIYQHFDDALDKKFSEQYDPRKLKLNIRFASWGSAGDKDGNNNVTAECTLEGVILHKRDILRKYEHTIDEILTREDVPDIVKSWLQVWQGKCNSAAGQLDALLPQFQAARDEATQKGGAWEGKTLLPEVVFDRVLTQVKEIDRGLSGAGSTQAKQDFLAELRNAYKATDTAEGKTALLNLTRRVETFGFTFGKIEYRETAEEYARVVDLVEKKRYSQLADDAKIKWLEELLSEQNAGELQRHIAEAMPKIKEGAMQLYDKTSAAPIAYQTLKRMELAREFPDMIQDNVLAECKGVQNMLEAVLIQRLAEKENKRPILGIVPLFEDPETMKKVETIVQNAYENSAYDQHLQLVADARGTGKKVQQVQIAHSDNARRAGLQAARGFIHRAHKKLREMQSKWNSEHVSDPIELQFFQGGSVSDAYRNGTRSLSETVDDFKLNNFIKFTFQGGDLVNYLNNPSSITRLFTRHLTHSAVGRRDTRNGGNSKVEWETNELMDDVAITALTETLPNYQQEDFNEKMSALLGLIGYERTKKAGNRGSRAASRGVAFATGSETGMGVAAQPEVKREEIITPVDIENARTISFSEGFQHAGIVPSWIGSQNLQTHIRNAIVSAFTKLDSKEYQEKYTQEDIKKFRDAFQDVLSTDFQPKDAATLYHHSPAFRDAQDRAAYGVALSEPEALTKLAGRAQHIDALPPAQQALRKQVRDYVGHLKKTYGRASTLARGSLNSGLNCTFASMIADPLEKMRTGVTNSLKRISDQIQLKSSYGAFLRHMMETSAPHDHDDALIHNGLDTVYHGRMLKADDTRYGIAVNDNDPAIAAISR